MMWSWNPWTNDEESKESKLNLNTLDEWVERQRKKNNTKEIERTKEHFSPSVIDQKKLLVKLKIIHVIISYYFFSSSP